MKVAAVGENLLERLALRANAIPRPLVETQVAFTAARAIMAGAELGIFECLATGGKDAPAIAAACGTDPGATRQLLDCLVGLGYLRYRSGQYNNPALARKWLVSSSPVTVSGKLRFQATEWLWMSKLEDYVRSGKGLDVHSIAMTVQQWAHYQDSMRALSVSVAPAVAKKLPVPGHPTAMLDIGGSHGLYSVALCRRYPSLRSTILELPQAAPEAARLLARENAGAKVQVQAGDALTDDLGTAQFDLVLLSNVAHHFSAADNQDLAAKVARALKPGGYYAIGEFIRSPRPGKGGAIAAISDLYFSLTSTSGTWNQAEIESWQRGAGLIPAKRARYTVAPGYMTIAARKTAAT